MTPAELLGRMENFDAPVADALLKSASGIAPSVCRELSFRALGEGRFFAKELTDPQKRALAEEVEKLQREYAEGRPSHRGGGRDRQAGKSTVSPH